VAEDSDSLERIAEALKEPVRITPGFTGRVMAEIDRLPPHAVGVPAVEPPVSWSRRRWTIRLSPLGGLAIAAGLTAVAVAVGRLAARLSVEPPVTRATVELIQPTQFVLVVPKAASVAVVGDFNDWNVSATPLLHADGDGVWWVTVPLAPGRYRYSFVVDGKTWVSDPEAPGAPDEFGRPNSVVTIGGS